METLHPREIDLGLSRIHQVAERLAIKKSQAKVITIAGTNGKGSCVRTLERLLVDNERRVGTFTSPHILAYNERIKINEVCVSDAELCDAFHRIDRARGDTTVTYFEFATLAALIIFQQSHLDYWVLEVGLGGRLDAVNIIDPDLAVITSIDLDHEHWLGDTREKIAVEKLGILRKGITCVCAEDNPTENMATIFAEQEVNTFLLQRDFFIGDAEDQFLLKLKRPEGNDIELALPQPRLPEKSVAAALQVLALVSELPTPDTLHEQILGLGLAGRFEIVKTPLADIVFDVAHNPAAGALLAEKVAAFLDHEVIAVVSMLADKNISDTLLPLREIIGRWVVCDLHQSPRAESGANIVNMLVNMGVESSQCAHISSVGEGVHHALTLTQRADKDKRSHTKKPIILVFGSFYTVAEAKEYLAIQLPLKNSETANG